MKKVALFLLTLFFMGMNVVNAQTKNIAGKVTSAEDNTGIPGVSVSVKGTTLGTITNVDGNYELKVPADAQTLVFSFVGMMTYEISIGDRTRIDVVMESSVISVGEVIVTGAYETKRAAKSVAAQTQYVSGEQLNVIRQTNVNNALAGKVSGIQVRSQSPVALDRTGDIRLRGDGGFGTGSGLIYVVDGTILPNESDLNMDIVEDITVLSGPAASALFGSVGANGAIVITTKKGRESARGFGVDVSTGIQFTNVYLLPNYQNSYAGGANYDLTKYTWKTGDPEEWKALDGKYYHNYSDDASWGPRMVGQEYIPWYSWYPGSKYTGTTAKLVPQPDNAKEFYETGQLINNTVSFSRATEDMNMRITYGNNLVKGNIPKSMLQKHNFSMRSELYVTDKLTVAGNVNFYTTYTKGEFDDNYSNQSTGSFNQWFHRNLDMNKIKELKELQGPGGIWASWNHNDPTVYNAANPTNFYAGNYWYSFSKYYDLMSNIRRADRLFGDASITYKILDDLSIRVGYRRQQNNTWYEEKYTTDLFISQTQATGNESRYKGYYSTSTSYSNIEDYESLLTYSKKFLDFQVNANAGMDIYRLKQKSNGANTVDGLNVPNLFTIANSKSQPSVGNGRTEAKYRAAFVRGDIGYKDFIFAEFTLRNDWYSALPAANNDVLSKSFGGSFVFSDLLKLPILNYGKLRASWGEIPKSINAYAYPGFAYGVGQYQWNGNFLMGTPDQLVDPNIHGAVSTQKEIGLELRGLENRIGITATYWDGTENDIPYSVSIAPYSGFTSKLINTGKITKKGIDAIVNVRPLWFKDLKWDVNATFSRLIENKVVRIAEGIEQFTVETYWGSTAPRMVHAVGKTWGQLYGNGKKMLNGKPVLDSNGGFVKDPNKYFGDVLPRVTGGVQNNIRFLQDFALNLNFDYQIGGKYYSLSEQWGTFSGLTARTAVLNDNGIPVRDPVDDGGGVHVVGVDADGKDVEYWVEGQDYFHGLYNNQVFDDFVYDLTFLKLREAGISYNLPLAKMGLAKWVTNAEISVVSQNVWLIYAKSRDIDPSEVSAAGGERGQFPGVRSIGANLKVSF